MADPNLQIYPPLLLKLGCSTFTYMHFTSCILHACFYYCVSLEMPGVNLHHHSLPAIPSPALDLHSSSV